MVAGGMSRTSAKAGGAATIVNPAPARPAPSWRRVVALGFKAAAPATAARRRAARSIFAIGSLVQLHSLSGVVPDRSGTELHSSVCLTKWQAAQEIKLGHLCRFENDSRP